MAFNFGSITRTLEFRAEDVDFFKKWYVILPDYIEQGGKKEDLLMVAGADCLLDILSDNGERVTLIASNTPFENCQQIAKLTIEELAILKDKEKEIYDSGAYYYMDTVDGVLIDDHLWLCDVLAFVFKDEFPEIIYYKMISSS